MESDEVRNEVLDLKRELNILKVKSDYKVPWYKEVPTIVAVLALVFSLGTTFVSYLKASEQEYISSRMELRSIMERLSDLPSRHADLATKYKNNPCLLYTSPSPRDKRQSRMPSSA